ncbi:hypothetical protein MBLNU459_g4065t1 [Dothideomycetes sp. NU459]
MAPSLEEYLPTHSSASATLDSQGDEPNSRPTTRYGKPLPENWIPLYQKPTRTPTRKLRVITIGAGVSAMGLAYKIHHVHKLDDYMDHVIYESNPDVGGTWLVNTYPGVACDVPAHVYTFPFEPNPDWSAYYASGAEIQQYFKRTVEKYDLARNVKCGHRVERAEFDEDEGKWHVRIRHGDNLINDSCDVLITATGFLNHWRWPPIEGLQSFKGHLAHSAAWSRDYDYSNKRIGVIGNGSSAIQIIPKLVEEAAHLTNFVRNPTWITPGLNSAFTKGSEAQKVAKESTAKLMLERLGGDTDLAARLTPDWEVGCRRATPGPGYLEAFTRANVTLVSDSIARIEPSGIRTSDGTLHEFDAIVCATGFDVSHRPPWPLVGRHRLELADAWKEEPESYLSLAASGFPNFFMFSGPNSPVGHGSLMSQLQWSADWMCQWIKKIAEEDIKWIDAKQEAVEDFNTYGDEIMQTLVWSGGCRSWYKNHRVDGKVTAVWAGSAITYKEMIDTIRPEDFEIRYRSKNRFRFLGNGKSKLEYEPGADLAFYIHK